MTAEQCARYADMQRWHNLTRAENENYPVSRSRCPRECTRTAATQLNVYLGVTDRTAAASVAPVAVDR